MRKAIVRDSDSKVLNVAEIQTGANWLPPLGTTARDDPSEQAAPDGTWVSGTTYLPPPAPTVVTPIVPMYSALLADQTGQNVNTAQTWFPGAGMKTDFNVPASSAYWFEGMLHLVRSAGSVSHTIAILFAGTATLTGITYSALTKSSAGNVLGPISAIRGDAVSAVVVVAANSVTTENAEIFINGIVRFNAAGTFIPQFQYSAAPGGAPTIKANSYFRMTPLGPNTAIGT